MDFALCIMSLTKLEPFVAFIVKGLNVQPFGAHIPPSFLYPQALLHPITEKPEIGRNNHIFLSLLAIPLMKSVQISEVAQKFPCCIIMKTLDQRKELSQICLRRLAM